VTSASTDAIWVPGGTFRMGSDWHYAEEAPSHVVKVDGFWVDRTPVTNRDFARFVEATGYVTFAELPPDPTYYPGALPEMLHPASLVFIPPGRPVDLRDFRNWWVFKRDANWRQHDGPGSSIAGLEDQPVGYERTFPVTEFPANGYGIFDMIGNVWEWTRDWFVTSTSHVGFRLVCHAAAP
jgi:sulfatase modifying factor 1